MSIPKQWWIVLFALGAVVGCRQATHSAVTPIATPSIVPTLTTPTLGAGFRFSTYGPPYDPGPDYWISVGQKMAARFPDAVPQTIWIVGRLSGKGTVLTFPGTTTSPYIYFLSTDSNEEILTRFDELGFQVWLQVEPGDASVEELIHLLLNQYGHHPSVIGVGVDVEWYQSYGVPEGVAVSDEVAATWLAAARSHGPHYRIFLKHWLAEKMPPTLRDGLVFIDDSQQFTSLDQMVAEFRTWGQTFMPASVGFQFGYHADRVWWRELEDPPGDIGQAILTAVPNTESLFWVDFTVLELFPARED